MLGVVLWCFFEGVEELWWLGAGDEECVGVDGVAGGAGALAFGAGAGVAGLAGGGGVAAAGGGVVAVAGGGGAGAGAAGGGAAASVLAEWSGFVLRSAVTA
jgi:hypothetical protein